MRSTSGLAGRATARVTARAGSSPAGPLASAGRQLPVFAVGACCLPLTERSRPVTTLCSCTSPLRLRAKPRMPSSYAPESPTGSSGQRGAMRAAACPDVETGGPAPRMTEQTLVEQALHLPRHEARRWRHTPLDQEDLVADGYLALAKAARRYDPSYDVPFTAFARPYVRGAITDAVRARARRERLGDGTFADVVGFPDLTPHGRRRCDTRLRAARPRPEPARHGREPREASHPRDAPRVRAHRTRPHDR